MLEYVLQILSGSDDLVTFLGVKKFIYISVHDYNLPAFALNNGYFIGKRKAESEILTAFPTSGMLQQT